MLSFYFQQHISSPLLYFFFSSPFHFNKLNFNCNPTEACPLKLYFISLLSRFRYHTNSKQSRPIAGCVSCEFLHTQNEKKTRFKNNCSKTFLVSLKEYIIIANKDQQYSFLHVQSCQFNFFLSFFLCIKKMLRASEERQGL